MIKAHWHQENNVGDTLTPYIVGHFLGEPIRYAKREATGKLLGVGSIMFALREDDVVWGTGCLREKRVHAPAGAKFLAVRGPLTRALIRGAEVPELYGDPALLLPLIYRPEMRKTHNVGIIPHYVDREFGANEQRSRQNSKTIDVGLPWRSFVDEVASCDRIISSSLHGIVIAEAYGIPAEWRVYSDNVIGKGFKFRDYFAGTGRDIKSPLPAVPIQNLAAIQEKLIAALKNHYGKN